MSNIATIGDADTVKLFKTVGADTYKINNAEEAIKMLEVIISKKYKIVFISENLEPALGDILEENPSLTYLYIPPVRGASGFGSKALNNTIQKAVGAKY